MTEKGKPNEVNLMNSYLLTRGNLYTVKQGTRAQTEPRLIDLKRQTEI